MYPECSNAPLSWKKQHHIDPRACGSILLLRISYLTTVTYNASTTRNDSKPTCESRLVRVLLSAVYVWYQSVLRQSIKAFEIIENEAKHNKREALYEFLVSVMLGPSPHRPRARQTRAKLLLR
jgi:hypothetical protein